MHASPPPSDLPARRTGNGHAVPHRTSLSRLPVPLLGLLCLLVSSGPLRAEPPGSVSTVAGGGAKLAAGDGGPARAAGLFPQHLALDRAGDLYVSDPYNHRVWRVRPDGTIRTIAGRGNGEDFTAASTGDGGLGTDAMLYGPLGLDADGAGGFAIAEGGTGRLRRVSPAGVIDTVAGGNSRSGPDFFPLFSGDGGPAPTARMDSPSDAAYDRDGNLYVADFGNHRVRKITPEGSISTVAGSGPTVRDSQSATRGTHYGDGGPASEAELDGPTALAVDLQGNLYIAELNAGCVRKVSPQGIITTVAGRPPALGDTSTPDPARPSGDGGPATQAVLGRPTDLAVDSAGNLFIVESLDHRVRKVTPDGVITTVAGDGAHLTDNDDPGATSPFDSPQYLVIDAGGNLIVSDGGTNRVRKVFGVAAPGLLWGRTYSEVSLPPTPPSLALTAGPAVSGLTPYHARVSWSTNLLGSTRIEYGPTAALGAALEGRPGTQHAADLDSLTPGVPYYFRVSSASFSSGMAVSPLLSFQTPTAQPLDPPKPPPGIAAGTVVTVAGTGEPGFSGDGGPGALARLHTPMHAAVDARGNLYIADTENGRIRKVSPDGTLSTVAGGGTDRRDDIPASLAQLNPVEVAVDRWGQLYVAESQPPRIRKVAPDGTITTVAGAGGETPADGVPADRAYLTEVSAIAPDSQGGLYFASGDRVRKIGPDGLLSTVAGGGIRPDRLGDDLPATEAVLPRPISLTVGGDGSLFIADAEQHRIRRVSPSGIITTVAGAGGSGPLGDGGPATQAHLYYPQGLAVDSVGYLYFADSGNQRIRRVTPDGIIATLAGTGTLDSYGYNVVPGGYGGDGGPAIDAKFNVPTTAAVDASGNVYICDSNNHRLRKIYAAAMPGLLAGGPFPQGDPPAQNQLLGGPAVTSVTPGGAVVSWTTALYAASRVEFGTSETLGQATEGRSGFAHTVSLSGLLPETAYQFRAVSVSDAGGTATSPVLTFTTCKAPPPDLPDGTPGSMLTLAGDGTRDYDGKGSYGGDGGPAVSARLNHPYKAVRDSKGNLYVLDRDNLRIRRVAPDGTITTVAGGGTAYPGDGLPGSQARLEYSYDLVIDGADVLYFTSGHRIRRITPDGILRTIAGGEEEGFSGDGGSASLARLKYPSGLAIDLAGNLYVADYGNGRVRVIRTDGIITTVAGNGAVAYGPSSGDGGPATRATLEPSALTVDAAGNLYVAHNYYYYWRVRKVTPDGTINSLRIGFFGPTGMAADASGNVYITETGNHQVRKLRPDGTLTRVAGAGSQGFSGDRRPALEAELDRPQGISLDAQGNLTIADTGNHRVRVAHRVGEPALPVGKVLSAPQAEPLSILPAVISLQQGDVRRFTVSPTGVPVVWSVTGGAGKGTIDPDGTYHAPSEIPQDTTAEVKALAQDGSGRAAFLRVGLLTPFRILPEGVRLLPGQSRQFGTAPGAPTDWTLSGPGTLDATGKYTAPAEAEAATLATLTAAPKDGSRRPATATVTLLAPKDPRDWTIDTFAGAGKRGVTLKGPQAEAVDARGNVYLSDTEHSRIVKVRPDGTPAVFAGGGTYIGDGRPASQTQIGRPGDIAVDSVGNVYFAEPEQGRVRKVGLDGRITTVAAPEGANGWIGLEVGPDDGLYLAMGAVYRCNPAGGLSPVTEMIGAWDLAFDRAGGLYITEPYDHRIVKRAHDGTLMTVVGTGQIDGRYGEGVPATRTIINEPRGIAVDSEGRLFYSDWGLSHIRMVDTDGIITTVAGEGFGAGACCRSGFAGDGGPANESLLAGPFGLALDARGDLLLADTLNDRVRIVYGIAAPGLVAARMLPAEPPPSLDIAPKAVTLPGGQTQAFTVSPAVPVDWAVEGGDVNGTVTEDGTYHAPDRVWAARSFTVTARAKDNPFAAASATVTLKLDSVLRSGIISTFAGGDSAGTTPGTEENVPATQVVLPQPRGLALDSDGNLYVSAGGRVRKVGADGKLTSVAGGLSSGPTVGDGGPAAGATLYDPRGLSFGPDGSLYLADRGLHRVRRVRPEGTISTLAGTGTIGSEPGPDRMDVGGYSGDGGPAASARVNAPAGVAADADGNVYIADTDNHRIRKVAPDGTITTVAGIGPVETPGVEPPPNYGGYSGDGGPAVQARLNFPADVTVGPDGSLYIADTMNHRIRKVNPSGGITTVAGGDRAGFAGDGGPAASALLDRPHGLSLDADGILYIADTGNFRVRKVATDGTISTVAGKGAAGAGRDGVPYGISSGDGGLATDAGLSAPEDVLSDGKGNLYIADTDGNRVRKVLPDGTITTVAGTGYLSYLGDGKPALQARFDMPLGVAADGWGNVFVADFSHHLIRKVAQDGTVSTVAGVGVVEYTSNGPRGGFSGDGGPATLAAINGPEGVAADLAGNLYFADTGNGRVRKVDPSGVITTVAGGGTVLGDGGPATQALVGGTDVALDSKGNLYIADATQHRIRKVTPNGTITTVAGNGSTEGPTGDGGPATQASVFGPEGIFIDGLDQLYIAETGRSRIRKVAADGTILTVAGTGSAGFSGDGGKAVNAMLKYPQDVAVDSQGNLYIADSGNFRVRRVNADGTIYTVAGDGTFGTSPDGIPAVTAALDFTHGIAVDASGVLLLTHMNRVRKVTGMAEPGLIAGRPFPLSALPVLPGDDNDDHQVDVRDAVYSLQIAVGLRLPVPQNDVNHDGSHDVADAVAILKSIVDGGALR